jgi:hypothetical protein
MALPSSVQPVGVVNVTEADMTAIRKLPDVAAVNVQVCDVVPFAAVEVPDSRVRFTHEDMGLPG